MGPLREVAWLRERLGAAGPARGGLPLSRWASRVRASGSGATGHIPGAAFLDVDRDLAARAGRARPPPAARRRRTSRPRHAAPGSAPARRWSPTTRPARAARRGSGGCCATSATTTWRCSTAACAPGARPAGRWSSGEPGTARAEPEPFSARPRSGDTATAEELARREARRAPPRRPRARSATAARSSRSTPWPATSPARVNLPFAELAPEGRFAEPAELRARFAAAGAARRRRSSSPTAARASPPARACSRPSCAGLGPARLYPGSWSEWSRRGYPVARQESARSTESRSSGPAAGARRRARTWPPARPSRLRRAPPAAPAPSPAAEPRRAGSSRRRRRPRRGRPRAGGAGSARGRARRERLGLSSIALHTAPSASAKVTGSTRGRSASSTKARRPTRLEASRSPAQLGSCSTSTPRGYDADEERRPWTSPSACPPRSKGRRQAADRVGAPGRRRRLLLPRGARPHRLPQLRAAGGARGGRGGDRADQAAHRHPDRALPGERRAAGQAGGQRAPPVRRAAGAGRGVGAREDDYEASGVPYSERGRRFDEMLAEMKSVWAGDKKGFAGGVGPDVSDNPPKLVIGGRSTPPSAAPPRPTAGSRRVAARRVRPGAREAREPRGARRAARASPMPARWPTSRSGTTPRPKLRRAWAATTSGWATTPTRSWAPWPRTRTRSRATSRPSRRVGCDELVFFPSSADPEQVDLLAGGCLQPAGRLRTSAYSRPSRLRTMRFRPARAPRWRAMPSAKLLIGGAAATAALGVRVARGAVRALAPAAARRPRAARAASPRTPRRRPWPCAAPPPRSAPEPRPSCGRRARRWPPRWWRPPSPTPRSARRGPRAARGPAPGAGAAGRRRH